MHKIKIVTVPSNDSPELRSIQHKLNTWSTTGLLVKYEIHTTGTDVVFNIWLKKEA